MLHSYRNQSIDMRVTLAINGLKKQFISFKVFSGKISSKIECFRASGNQRFSSSPNMVGGKNSVLRTIVLFVEMVNTLCRPNSNPALALADTLTLFAARFLYFV